MLWFTKRKQSRTKNEANEIAQIVVGETQKVFEGFHLEVNNRFREIQAQLNKLDQNIEILEKKLFTKELQDKQQYGHIQYKLNEVGNQRLKKELDNLKEELAQTKPRSFTEIDQ
ncbi:MAG: hypothetical protein ACOCUH_00490 [Bacteriovoracia bacterium]